MLQRFAIVKDSDVGIVVLNLRLRASELGYSEDQISRLSTAVSELTYNILKYSPERGGELRISERASTGSPLRLVIQALDNGPGIADLEQAMQDHFSTGKTLGLGLPGVRRIMDHFEIVSVLGEGTMVTIAMDL